MRPPCARRARSSSQLDGDRSEPALRRAEQHAARARVERGSVTWTLEALARGRPHDRAAEVRTATVERREFAVGNLYINRKVTGSQVDAQPFGGFKLSGTGVKAGSPDYLLHFMDARCITENTLRSGFVPNEARHEDHTEVS